MDDGGTDSIGPDRGHSRASRLWGLLVFMFPLTVYVLTAAPTVYGLDSAELATGAYTLGIVHSPGCPLYLLLGHLFARIPVGDVGYRLNLMSCVCAALAVYLVYRVLLVLTGIRWFAVTSAWALAFSFYFWVWAVVAELYALHACFAAGLLLLVLQWEREKKPHRLPCIALVFGLGMGNHTSLILLLPGLAWIILTDESRPLKQARLVLFTVCCGLLGATVYLYLPLRHMASPPMDYVRDYFPEVNLVSWRGMVWMVSGGMFKRIFFDVPLPEVARGAARCARQLIDNFGAIGVLVGLVGVRAGFKKRRRLHIGLALLFVCHTLFFLSYGALDRRWMFSVTYLVWGVWLGIGMADLAAFFRRTRHDTLRRLPFVVSAILVFWLLCYNCGRANMRRDDSARRMGQDILAALRPQAVFFGLWEHVSVLEYLQLVEGCRPDVTVRNLVFLGAGSARRAAHKHLGEGLPVYSSCTNVLSDGALQFSNVLDDPLCYRVDYGGVSEPQDAKGESSGALP